MIRKNAFLLVLPLALASLQPLTAVPCASPAEAEAAIRKAWPAKYPGETIQKYESAGEASAYTKLETTGKETIDEYGNRWEYVKNATYCRIPARVTARRASGSMVVFDVSAIFRQVGGAYSFMNIGVGGSSEVASSGQEAPGRDAIKKLIADLWVSLHPGSKVERVAISDPELKKDSTAGRWWYTTGADIYVTDENGTKQKCSNDYTTIFKGETGKEGVNASGPWKASFLDDPACR